MLMIGREVVRAVQNIPTSIGRSVVLFVQLVYFGAPRKLSSGWSVFFFFFFFFKFNVYMQPVGL